MQTTHHAPFSDGSIATVIIRVARQEIVVLGEAPFSEEFVQDSGASSPFVELCMQTEDVCNRLVEAREALMRCGYKASCSLANILTIFTPQAHGATNPIATIYGDYDGLAISGPKAETLARTLDAEGVKVLVD